MPEVAAPSPMIATARAARAAPRRLDHAERRGDRSSRVTRAERVVRALLAPQEATRPVGLLHLHQPREATGQRLVAVGLMADVPDQPIARRIEQIVERDGQLDGAQAPGEVTADFG